MQAVWSTVLSDMSTRIRVTRALEVKHCMVSITAGSEPQIDSCALQRAEKDNLPTYKQRN